MYFQTRPWTRLTTDNCSCAVQYCPPPLFLRGRGGIRHDSSCTSFKRADWARLKALELTAAASRGEGGERLKRSAVDGEKRVFLFSASSLTAPRISQLSWFNTCRSLPATGLMSLRWTAGAGYCSAFDCARRRRPQSRRPPVKSSTKAIVGITLKMREEKHAFTSLTHE